MYKISEHISFLQGKKPDSSIGRQSIVEVPGTKRGYRIKEAPVVWIDQVGSKVNPLRDALNMLTELMEIRLNDLSRKYS